MTHVDVSVGRGIGNGTCRQNAHNRLHRGLATLLLIGCIGVAGLSGPPAEAKTARVIEQDGFLIYDLNRSNLRPLPSGDFMFRLAVDKATGATFWAYMGTTEDIVVTLVDPELVRDDNAVRSLLLRIVHLPTRVGCGVGTIHTSNFVVLDEGFSPPLEGGYHDLGPRLIEGQIQNDTSDAMPPRFLAYANRALTQ